MTYEILCTDNTFIYVQASGRSGCYHAAKKQGKTIHSYKRVGITPEKRHEMESDKVKAEISAGVPFSQVNFMPHIPTCPKCYKPIVESDTGKHCNHCGWGLRFMKLSSR